MSVISVTFHVGRQCTSSNAHGGTDQSSCKVLQCPMNSGAVAAARLSASQLPLLASLLQLPVALRVDRGLPTQEHVVRRHVQDRAVQPDMVIVIYVLLNQAFSVLQRQWRSLPNAFPFQRLVPAF